MKHLVVAGIGVIAIGLTGCSSDNANDASDRATSAATSAAAAAGSAASSAAAQVTGPACETLNAIGDEVAAQVDDQATVADAQAAITQANVKLETLKQEAGAVQGAVISALQNAENTYSDRLASYPPDTQIGDTSEPTQTAASGVDGAYGALVGALNCQE